MPPHSYGAMGFFFNVFSYYGTYLNKTSTNQQISKVENISILKVAILQKQVQTVFQKGPISSQDSTEEISYQVLPKSSIILTL